MNRLVAMSVLFLLAGCNIYKTYESVQSGPRAKVVISKMSHYPGKPEIGVSARMRVTFFEPTADCSFGLGKRLGNIDLDREESTKTVFVPAGRAYFVIDMKFAGYMGNLTYASFLLEDGKEYWVQFRVLNSEDPDKLRHTFEFWRFEDSGRKAIPIEVDHWSICEHEKQAPKE